MSMLGARALLSPPSAVAPGQRGHPILAQQGVLHPGPGQELQYILSPAGGSRHEHLLCLICLERSPELVSPPRGQWDCWEEELVSVGMLGTQEGSQEGSPRPRLTGAAAWLVEPPRGW